MDERAAALLEIMRVGPKGYIHGWIHVGAPGVGAEVFHPHHGHGTVTAHNGAQATVRFHKSGNEHTFSARPGPGKPRLEPADVRDTISHAKMRVDQIEKRLDYHAVKSVDPGIRPALSSMRDELGKSHPDVAKLKADMAKLDQLLQRGGKRGPNRDQELISFYQDLGEAIDGIHYLRTTPVAQRASDLKYGHGSALWAYWTRGKGFAKWSGAAHKWTTLHALLLKAGVPAHSADGLTTNIITAVMPGYMRLAHAKSGHKAGRSEVTTTVTERADTKKPYGDVPYGDPGYLDAAGNQASKSGKPGVKRYPLTSDKVMAAWSYINQAKNAGQYTPEQLKAIKGRIRAAMSKHGHDVSEPASASRTESVFSRIWELEDIRIVSRAQGDSSGRLVEAYAAVFNVPAEIHDQHGDYNEENDPGSFNRSIDHAARQSRSPFRCIYNHGMTLMGTPSDRGSIPIGTPEEVRAESRGLLTRTRYNETSLADDVLEAIRSGGITAQSYTGRILRSSPELRRGEKYRPGRDGRYITVRRLELALREYGPTPFPAFSGAEILGVRMSTPGEHPPGPDDPQEDEALPPDGEPAVGDPLIPAEEVEGHSVRHHQHALFVLRSQEMREECGLVW